MTKFITVALVDDDAAVRDNWAALINRSASVRCVHTYASAEEALKHIPGHPPAVVLMDIRLPGMSGIECTARLKAACPDICIVMLTTYGDSDSIFEALRAGASGYLLKRVTPEVLVKSIMDAHGGGAPMSSQIARQVVGFFHAQSPGAPTETALTTREQELLSLLAKGRHYKEIADGLGIAVDTVRSHIRRIYEKMHVHSRTEAVVKFLNTPPPPS
jgi:DNA-binding NarL/FixJ family response regulator